MKNKNINSALVEDKRPPIYTAMKYWGKKPHNIWREYIDCYTPENGKFLDPFCGSAMSAFEAVKVGKTAYAFDLNPLTSFIIEVLSSNFENKTFQESVYRIINDVKQDKQYKEEYEVGCQKCNHKATIINFKWNNKNIYEVAVECPHCHSRYTLSGSECNLEIFIPKNKKFTYWFPTWKFPNKDAFSNTFIKNIGGDSFSSLWSERNLYILSKIFNLIEKEINPDKQKQLLFGFIQTVHLCSKMCVPRRKEANRDFSTSWGRSSFLCAKRQMEMNPLYLFENSCIGKQSVQSALLSAQKYLTNKPKIHDVTSKLKANANVNLYYGIIDIKSIDKYLPSESIDFILTDPPYGGLVKYLDLSSIWLSWLYKIDKKYLPDFSKEITVENDNYKKFYEDFLVGLKKIYNVLKNEGKLVLTFNNKDLKIWNMFLNAITNAGFKIEKVIHQQNKRTGESNVSSKFGMSSSDFYFRCVKSKENITSVKLTPDEYENFIVETVKKIIKKRNEPTNYDILYAGLLGELSLSNFDINDCNQKIENILKRHIDIDFTVHYDNGNKWYLKKHKTNKRTLTQQVEETLEGFVKSGKEVNRDDLLKLIFKTYPNGLTPDPVLVDQLIDKILKGVNND